MESFVSSDASLLIKSPSLHDSSSSSEASLETIESFILASGSTSGVCPSSSSWVLDDFTSNPSSTKTTLALAVPTLGPTTKIMYAVSLSGQEDLCIFDPDLSATADDRATKVVSRCDVSVSTAVTSSARFFAAFGSDCILGIRISCTMGLNKFNKMTKSCIEAAHKGIWLFRNNTCPRRELASRAAIEADIWVTSNCTLGTFLNVGDFCRFSALHATNEEFRGSVGIFGELRVMLRDGCKGSGGVSGKVIGIFCAPK
jgi:hypothetical protein